MPALTGKEWNDRLAVADPTRLDIWDAYLAEILAPGAADRMTEAEYSGLRQEISESAYWASRHQREPAAAR